MDLENLEAAGMLGLVEAANRFQPERGVFFKTFAYTRIRGAIYDELRRNCPLPQDLLEKLNRIQRLMQTLPPPVSIETLAKQTGLSEDDVVECLAAIRLTRMLSWSDVSEKTVSGGPHFNSSPAAKLEDVERRKLLIEAISTLPNMERLAITLYYLEDLRLKEIGLVLTLSESRVSRLLKAARHKLEE